MKRNNKTIDTVKTIMDTGVYGIGILGSIAVINRCCKQAIPQIKEAEGWRKVWYVIITTLTIGFYGGTIFINAFMSIDNIYNLLHNLVKKPEPYIVEPLREEVVGDEEDDVPLSGMEHYWKERETED